jgi:hypothetical protein
MIGLRSLFLKADRFWLLNVIAPEVQFQFTRTYLKWRLEMRSLIPFLLLTACGSPSGQGVDTDTIPTDDTDCIDCTDTDDTDVTDTDDTGDPPCCTDDIDDDNDGYTENQGDCDDEQPAMNPMATDIVGDEIDQNCDGADGFDSDGDGHASPASGGDDCDDTDHFTFPGAIEIWYDGKAQGCQVGPTESWNDYDQDGDGDFIPPYGRDCNDTNPNISSSYAAEINGNGVDDNCSGEIDGLRATLTWNPSGNPVFEFHMLDDDKGRGLWMLSANLDLELHDDSDDDGDGYDYLQYGGYESWLSLRPVDTAFEDEFTTLTYMYMTPDYELNGLGVNCVIWGPNVQALRDAVGSDADDCVESDPTAW